MPEVSLVVQVMDRREPIADPLAQIRHHLGEWGIALEPGGLLSHNGFIGHWAWLPPAVAGERFAGAAWLAAGVDCPFVGRTLGYLAIDIVDADQDRWEELLIALVKEGRGVLSWPTSGHIHHAVTRQRRELSSAVGKYGLDDGGQVLDRASGPYATAVVTAVNCIVAAAGGPDDATGWIPTCHNPLRWSDEAFADRFGHLEVDLWLFDFDLPGLRSF